MEYSFEMDGYNRRVFYSCYVESGVLSWMMDGLSKTLHVCGSIGGINTAVMSMDVLRELEEIV